MFFATEAVSAKLRGSCSHTAQVLRHGATLYSNSPPAYRLRRTDRLLGPVGAPHPWLLGGGGGMVPLPGPRP